MAGGAGIAGGSGTDPFAELMRLLGDPAKLQAEYERLTAAKADAQAVVDLAGPASEIVQIRQQLVDAQTDIHVKLAAAEAQAADLLAAAQAQVDTLLARAQADAQKIAADAKQLSDEAFRQLDAARIAQATADKTLATAAARNAEADATLAAIWDKDAELATREAALAIRAQMISDAQAHLADTVTRLTE